MRNFISFIKEFHIYKKKELLSAFVSFSRKEIYIFFIILIIAFILTISLLVKINTKFMISIPADGGSITEGIIGMATLVNPILAISDADKDLTSIVYSGLMRKMPDGTFILDLADSYDMSSDGINYTFILKKNIEFHDGSNITVDDVIFTIEKIKNPAIKSPKKNGWEGITVKKIDSNIITFTLNQPYISFMDNTTIGILPSKIWEKVSDTEFSISPLNIKAIGSGPYKIKSVYRNKDGIPEKYSLKRFKKFILGKPYIKYLNIISYANKKDLIKALLTNSINQASGINPEGVEDIKNSKYKINTATLPRIFGLFFNSNKNNIFSNSNVIKAFNYALDRQDIIDQVLNGYGTIIFNPIPETIINNKIDINDKNNSIENANKILDDSGWIIGEDGFRYKGGISIVEKTKKVGKKTITEKVKVDNGSIVKLAFSVITSDTPELKKAISIIKEQLKKIGVQVDMNIYESGQLNQLIKERDYEALFFGQIVNHESDLFSFWHSSQRNDPGLNIAMYNNKKVDTILESLQKTLNIENRLNKYDDLINEFNNNIPALFVYSPKYLYITSINLEGVILDTITIPSNRFALIYEWYTAKDNVWKIFNKNNISDTNKE